MDVSKIREHMPVVCSNGDEVGKVDHPDSGNTIKLTKDNGGQHHWLPLSWVARVDDKVHLDRSRDQARKEWFTSPPAGVTS
jgi:hypothetical protein